MGGYTKWAYQTLESDIFFWKPDKWFKMWFYIVMSVNHKDNKLFKRGKNLFTYMEIAESCKTKVTTVDNFIRWLKSTGMITTQKTTRGFIIEVIKFNYFQNPANYKSNTKNDTKNETLTKHKRNTNDTINKEVNKDNIYIDRFLTIWQLYPKKVGKNKAFEHFKRTVKTEKDLENTKKALNNYLQTKRVKEGFIQDGKRWFKEWQDWIEYKEEEKGKEDWRDAHRRKKT